MASVNTNYSQMHFIAEQTKSRVVSESEKQTQELNGDSRNKAATLNISNQGLQQYKDSLKPQNGVILTDYSTMIGNRMPSIYGEKNDKGEYDRNFYSVSDTSSNLLKAYAGLYDEIVKGHEAGTRETYVEDKTAENGYRKLTMEEELNELDKAYKDYADKYASNRDKNVIDILSAHAKKVSEISGGRTNIANKANELLEKYKKDPVPEDFSNKMIGAAKSFVKMYKGNTRVDISSLLKEVSIFTK